MPTPEEILTTYWGHQKFRPQQREIVEAVLDKKDVLALLPTGGGKSICYQVPALALEGVCLVISPLVALMKDQVLALRQRNVLAEAIYSGQSYQHIDRVLDNCVYGSVKVLYVAPERIGSEIFVERVKRINVSLIAVDEAHCISEWGFDFRPAYLNIHKLREWKPQVPLIALTATATPKVQEDIQVQLKLKHPVVFRSSFARDNLCLTVYKAENKQQTLAKLILSEQGQGIVYARSRKACKELALYFQKKGISALHYHAGLTHAEREQTAMRWGRGEVRTIVATNAFGMGIDKSDVRFVYHYDLPESIEAYYQEAGRAGRDGHEAQCAVVYHDGDIDAARKKLALSFPPLEYVRSVYQHLSNYYRLAIGSAQMESFDFDLEDFKTKCKLEPVLLYNALKTLEEEGFVQFNESFHSPSLVSFAVGYEKLYEFQVANPRLDLYIKALLRLYGGEMFQHHTFISESKLAKYLQVSDADLVKNLELLKKLTIITYEPANNKPKITFLIPRQDAAMLPFDKKRLKEIESRKTEKLEEVIHYVNNRMCRMTYIQEYFGENAVSQCGKCDNCRSKLLDNSEIEKMLKEEVLTGNKKFDEFVEAHPELKLSDVRAILKRLMDV
jgi:ATP-dependent DNA helicase RecQ